MKPILLVVALVGCQTASPVPSTLAGCYVLAWQEPQWEAYLPDSVYLETRLDSALGPRYQNSFLLKPMVPQSDTNARWRNIGNAWWGIRGRDSFALTLNSIDAGWYAQLGLHGDSVSGTAIFSSFPHDREDTFPIQGTRVPCPKALGA